MADLSAARTSLSAAASQRDELAAQLAELGTVLASERRQLVELEARGDVDGAAASRARIAEIVAARATPTRDLAALHDSVAAGLEALLGVDLALEADVPLVLLPVRVEVRSTADQAALRVRIYPDTIHAEALDEGLSDAERAAGIAFWTATWESGDPDAAWPSLVEAVGASRGSWVAEALRPVNLVDRPGVPPQFPDTAQRGTLPAVVRTLPDRFFVRVEQDGAAPATRHGNVIPDALPVGLTDRDDLSVLRMEGEDLPPIDASMRWLVEYDEAVRVGMAVTVPLPLAGRPVRRLFVYGVRAALEPSSSADRLTRMLRSHRYTDGAEFVAQGTPTNNTDSARAAWSKRTRPGAPDLADRDPRGVDNAGVLAAALGVDEGFLSTLPNARDRESERAAAINRLLWTSTWGEAIEHLTRAGRANGDARLDAPGLDAVRDHWIAQVRGRGPLPAIRVGRQPYGVLPIAVTHADVWRPLSDGAFVDRRLVPFLGLVRRMWDAAATGVPTVMEGPLDEALPEILGTDAVLQALRVRTALSPDPTFETAMALTIPGIGDGAAQHQVSAVAEVVAGIGQDALDDPSLGTKTRALALPLVHESDLDFIRGLLEPQPPAMRAQSVLQVLLGHAVALERHERDSEVDPGRLDLMREVVASTQAEVDQGVLASALDAVTQGDVDRAEIIDGAFMIERAVGRLDRNAVADRHPIAALRPPTTLQQVAGAEPSFDRMMRNDIGLQILGEVFRRARWSSAFRDALRILAQTESIDERRLLLAETLDCCSHRLDAWLTSIASRRVAELRERGGKGAFFGAFGWLEDIVLASPTAAGQVDGRDVLRDGMDGGFVHAPGLTQATTAGVLRSGRLAHRRSDPNAEPLDIDLSSTRTRDALALLDGMRHGQSLGALLGYRLERRLHDRSGNGLELDRFIYVLRTLAPLRGGKLTEPLEPVVESLAASDVVDGLRLAELAPSDVTNALRNGPQDARYIPPGSWVPPTEPEEAAVLAAIAELERTHDAVADLLLAESVHQLVSGNPARSAAALDALGAGESVPPDPDVVRTPRTGVAIQHRVTILVTDPPPATAAGWDPDAPRARAEPRLEVWAQGALGDPRTIQLAAGDARTLADAGLSALDVLYDADGDRVASSTLVARLRRAIPDLGPDPSTLATTWELAALLRAMVSTARALDVADVGRPVREDAVGRRPDTAEWLARANDAVAGLGAVLAPEAIAALDPMDPPQLEGLDAAQQAAAVAAHEAASALQQSAVDTVVAALAPFGVRPPPGLEQLDLAERATAARLLAEETVERQAAAATLLARAVGSPDAGELAGQALVLVFGRGFLTVPVLLPPPAGEADLWVGAVGPAGVRARPGAEIRPWLTRMGRLRAGVSAYTETLLVREALGRRPALRTAQSPSGAFATWVGLPFPDARPPDVPIASMVAELGGVAADGVEPDLTGGVAGLVLDEWTEVLPRRLLRGDPNAQAAATELVDVVTTGVALNANAPGARPPQTILVACTPDGADWTGDRLVAVLEEAMALARMRGVTLEDVPFVARYLPALYFRDWSLQGEPVIDFRAVAAEFTPDAVQKFAIVRE